MSVATVKLSKRGHAEARHLSDNSGQFTMDKVESFANLGKNLSSFTNSKDVPSKTSFVNVGAQACILWATRTLISKSVTVNSSRTLPVLPKRPKSDFSNRGYMVAEVKLLGTVNERHLILSIFGFKASWRVKVMGKWMLISRSLGRAFTSALVHLPRASKYSTLVQYFEIRRWASSEGDARMASLAIFRRLMRRPNFGRAGTFSGLKVMVTLFQKMGAMLLYTDLQTKSKLRRSVGVKK